MHQVWKFPLDVQAVMMPDKAQPLHVGSQDGRATLWALVDPAARLVPRSFIVKGTGQDVPDHRTHIGTYFTGPFVWHVFEYANPAERPWIDHDGGDNPLVGGVVVEYQCRDGSTGEAPANAMDWRHGALFPNADVVRYREAAEQPAA